MFDCKTGDRCCAKCKERHVEEEHDNENPAPHDAEETQQLAEPYKFIYTVRSVNY